MFSDKWHFYATNHHDGLFKITKTEIVGSFWVAGRNMLGRWESQLLSPFLSCIG